jgi:hypothetical protein
MYAVMIKYPMYAVIYSDYLKVPVKRGISGRTLARSRLLGVLLVPEPAVDLLRERARCPTLMPFVGIYPC